MGALQDLHHVMPVEPLRLGLRPRQVEHHANPLDVPLGHGRAGPQRAGQRLRQRVANGRRHGSAIQSPENLIESIAGREEITERVATRGTGRRSVRRGNGLRGTALEQRWRRLRTGGRVVEQVERLGIIHGNCSAGNRQVGEIPQIALLRRGNDVGRVRGLAVRRHGVGINRAAEDIESLTVLVDGRRIHELHHHVLPSLQQLRAHASSPS